MTKPEERTSRHKGKAGLARIWRALFYSFAGLTSAFRKESAFRQELALAVVLVLIAVALPATLVQIALLINAILLVLVAELPRLPQLTHDFGYFSSFDSRNSLILLSPIFVTPL